jgi:hypothetical protein
MIKPLLYSESEATGVLCSEEGTQATRKAGHLGSAERVRNKNKSREATTAAKQTVFMSVQMLPGQRDFEYKEEGDFTG